MFCADSLALLQSNDFKKLAGKVNLVFTSPPFPLTRKKRYGNELGQKYIDWLVQYGAAIRPLLSSDGSLVIEMGNSWESGDPIQSTLALEALLTLQKTNDYYLCQEFIWHNPARLPTPAQWVNIERIRVKDGFTRLWWLATSKKPKADNRSVLREYSAAMKLLLDRRRYNSGKRPSEHSIGERSFLKNNGGSIPSNVLTFTNTSAHDRYQNYCRDNRIPIHPARMPVALAQFFVQFLTSQQDLVLDPFAGSNTTGAAAELLQRRWLSIETNADYVNGSRGRFLKNQPK